jgi:hypothetical protein
MRAESRGRSRGFDCAPSNAQHIGVEAGINSMRRQAAAAESPTRTCAVAGQLPHGVTIKDVKGVDHDFDPRFG